MRDEGWYWVLIGEADEKGRWQVAEWRDSFWWTCGSDLRWGKEDVAIFFKQIGERCVQTEVAG